MRFIAVKAFAAAFVLAISGLYGQTSRGTLTGIVTDPSTAAVPNAIVKITNVETNVSRGTATNQRGVYRFDAVDPGSYEITIESQGFRTYTKRSLFISAAQVVAWNATLEIGETANTVEITGETATLQTESAVRGGTINSVQASSLPVFSRNPNMLAITMPGVTEQRADLPGTSTFSVNGARGRSNNFLLDGTENNDISVAGQGFQIKNPDTIVEVSVQTGIFDAEFGRAGGAVVNTITRSGTNELHGSLGWIADFTNDDAITNTLSTSPAIISRGKLPPGYEQYYNGTVGGPIRKDKTFFFASWQEQRRRATSSTTLFTLSSLGREQLRNAIPAGTNPRADLYLDITKDVAASGQFSDIALRPEGPNVQFGNAVYAYPLQVTGRQTLNRVDHHFSDSDLMSFRYGYDNRINPTAIANFPGFFTSETQRYHNAVFTETHIFSPSLTNELRIPFNRITFEYPNDAADPRAQTMPTFNFTQVSPLGVAGGIPQGRIANNYIIQDTMNWVKGRHSFRFGLDLLQQRSRQIAPASTRGALTYGSSNSGGRFYHSFANFLDDFGGSGTASRDFGSPTYYPELFRQAYFFQDRWQVRENLTLTLGLRWEDFGTPVNSLRTPAYAGLFNVQVNRADRTWTAPMTEPNETSRDLNNFSPVVGVTWSPRFQQGLGGFLFGDRRSVIRAGYHIGYDSFFNNIASNAAGSSPNLVATGVPSPVTTEFFRGLPNFSSLLPMQARAVLPTDNQQLVVKDLRNPYYQRWSFGIQRELPFQMVLDTAYVGSAGVRLYINEDLNPQVLNSSLSVLPSGFSSLADLQSALPAGYTLRPNIDPLQGARNIRTNGGHSTYHSAQFNLSKRFSRNMGFNAAYTWSKLLDNGSELYTFNNTTSNAAIPAAFGGQGLEKGLSLYDRTHRFVVSYVYEIPVMKSQAGFLGRIAGGWSIGGVTTLESGVPLNVTNGADADGLGGSLDRPNVNPAGQDKVRARPDAASATGYVNPDLPGNPPIDPATARYIGLKSCDTTNFASCITGNAGRNLERTPALNYTNANVMKSIRLTERFRMEFRTEFYNIFNKPQYGQYGASPFTPQNAASITPSSNVTTSAAGRFLNYSFLEGGGRVIRYQLKLTF